MTACFHCQTSLPLSDTPISSIFARHCPTCGALALEFPGERNVPTRWFWWSGRELQAIGAGELGPVVDRLPELRQMARHVHGRQWAKWFASLYDDLDRWEGALGLAGQPEPFYNGVCLLQRQRRQAPSRPPEPAFADSVGIAFDFEHLRAAWSTRVGPLRFVALRRQYGRGEDALFAWEDGQIPTAVLADCSSLERLTDRLMQSFHEGSWTVHQLHPDGTVRACFEETSETCSGFRAEPLSNGLVAVHTRVQAHREGRRLVTPPVTTRILDATGTLCASWRSVGGRICEGSSGLFSIGELDDEERLVALTLRCAETLRVVARSETSSEVQLPYFVEVRGNRAVTRTQSHSDGQLRWRLVEARLVAEPHPRSRSPADDGFRRRVANSGHCWSGDGHVFYWPDAPSAEWAELATVLTGRHADLFAMAVRPADSPPRIHAVHSGTGARSLALECPAVPCHLAMLGLGEAVVVVADDAVAILRIDDREPRWLPLPEVCRPLAACGDDRVVLQSMDAPRRLHFVHLTNGYEGTLADACLADGPGGPVFVEARRWLVG